MSDIYDIIILHGTMGSPEGNWFPWLKKELQNLGHTVYVPKLPTPEDHTPDNWCAALRDQAPDFNDNTVLIGHSLGATFILHILETLKNPVAKSIFASVVINEIGIPEYDALNKSFFKTPDFDWFTISHNSGQTFLLHGENDPYVPQSHSEFLQNQIGGDLIIIPDGGHLNTESNYTDFPEVLNLLNNKEKEHA